MNNEDINFLLLRFVRAIVLIHLCVLVELHQIHIEFCDFNCLHLAKEERQRGFGNCGQVQPNTVPPVPEHLCVRISPEMLIAKVLL